MELKYIKNLPSFGDLPVDVIEHIQDYLPMTDLLSSSVTCQQWFKGSQHPRLRKRIKLFVGYENFGEKVSIPTDLLVASTRIYENIKLQNVEFNHCELPFFQKCGMNIKQFTLIEFKVDYKYFLEILNCLPSLEKLELTFYFTGTDFFDFDLDKVPVGLRNLKSLLCKYNFFCSANIINKIASVIPNLEEFAFNEHLIAEFGQNDCFNFLNKYRRTLKTLRVSKNFCDSLFENGPVTIDELDLKELYIFTNHYVATAVQFILTQNNLTKLDVFLNLTFEQIKLICDSLPNLESLTYYGVKLPSKSISKLKNLKALYLKRLIDDDSSIIEAIGTNHNETLEVLHLNKRKITKTLSPLFINLQNLRDLYLYFNETDVDVFQLIFKYLINLEILYINWVDIFHGEKKICTNDMETEYYDVGRLNKLKSLTFQFSVEKIPGFSFEHLLKLKKLTHLKYNQNTYIKINDILRLMHSLPLLKTINFRNSIGIYRKVVENGSIFDRLDIQRL